MLTRFDYSLKCQIGYNIEKKYKKIMNWIYLECVIFVFIVYCTGIINNYYSLTKFIRKINIIHLIKITIFFGLKQYTSPQFIMISSTENPTVNYQFLL